VFETGCKSAFQPGVMRIRSASIDDRNVFASREVQLLRGGAILSLTERKREGGEEKSAHNISKKKVERSAAAPIA
jgi:hypothetical protein